MIAIQRDSLADVLLAGTQEIEIRDYPIVSGVYFLMLAGTVVYVGQSRNVHQRIMGHQANYKVSRHRANKEPSQFKSRRDSLAYEFDEARYIEVDVGSLDEYEQRAIAAFGPKHNSDASINACRRKYPKTYPSKTT